VFKQFDGRTVLENVSLSLAPAEIAGLVGDNGSGKTTLLRLISGSLEPDQGSIEAARALKVGYLTQDPDVRPENTLHEEVGSAFAELLAMEKRLHELSEAIAAHPEGPKQQDLLQRYDRMTARFEVEGGYTFTQRMNEILGGLGFSSADHDLPVSALSGGQRCRAALARLLLQDHTFLLLDEPTNHLDLDATAWLERFLAAHDGGALIVSHDRYLLDRVTQRIVEVDRGQIQSFPGNYTRYVQARSVRRLTQARQFEKDQAFIEKEREFIARFQAGQRSKEAQGRRTRLQAGEFTLHKPEEKSEVRFDFKAVDTRQLGQVRIEALSKRYGEKELFRELRFQVMPRERFAITGPNGCGKSTLLKILLGLIEPDSGEVELTLKSEPGYYAQDASGLASGLTVLETVREACAGLSEPAARTTLARFGFKGDEVFKPVSVLSGGEQSRLRLVCLILSSPALLVLDEPTNHLDIQSREALEEALLEFPGTIIAVSHDRYFIDRFADRLLVLRPDTWRVIHGNYSDYVREEQAHQEALASQAEPGKSGKPPVQPRRPAAGTTPSPYDGMPIEQLEARIIEQEARIMELNSRFSEPEVYRNPQRLAEIRAALDAAKRELSEAEESWGQRDF
jgi:ATP-binding cassette subfamily F protein 3